MRIRTIKPEFWLDEELSLLPEATHLLAAALLNYADDFGFFNANPRLIQADTSPLREPSVSIPESLVGLQKMGYVVLGTAADGKRFGRIVNFDKHQRVSHPTPSRISSLSIIWDGEEKPPENIVNPPETFRPEVEQGAGNGTGSGERTREEPAAKTKPLPSSMPDAFRTREFKTLWDEWEDHCIQRRQPLSSATKRLQLAECAQNGVARSLVVIAGCMKAGKTALYFDFDRRANGNGSPPSGPVNTPKPDPEGWREWLSELKPPREYQPHQYALPHIKTEFKKYRP